MKTIWKNLIAGTAGLAFGAAAEFGVSKLLNRRWPDEFDQNHELTIGDGLDEDLREDPPED